MTTYKSGEYRMVLVNDDGHIMIFESIQLSVKQAREVFKTLRFYGVEVMSIDLIQE